MSRPLRTSGMVLGILAALSVRLQATTAATLQVDAGQVLQSVSRGAQLGQNLDLWKSLGQLQPYQVRLAAADVRHFRYPGGALADVFHWNSNGSYDANGYWRPSATVFTAPGFRSDLRNRGTTDRGSSVGSFPSKLTDGNTATEWRSDTLTAQSIDPWFYIDLGSSQSANKLVLTWGTPYASAYKIQRYTGASTTPYTDNDPSGWSDVSVSPVTGGTGGVDTRTFTSVTTRFIRVQMTSSSGTGFAVKEAQVYNGATLISAHANDPATQSLCVAAPTGQASDANATWVGLGFEDFMAFLQGVPGGAEAVITVNLGTGTPEEAAAWVSYANVQRGYGIKRWQLGNEVEGVQMPGGPMNGYYYAEKLRAYAAAMKAVDPTILIEGPELAWLQARSRLFDGASWTTAFFNRLQATSSLTSLDVLSFHDYPNWSNSDPAASLATYRAWSSSTNAYVQAINSSYYPSSPLPLHLSESNSGDATSFTVTLGNALWAATYYPEFMKAWGNGGWSSFWFTAGDMYQGGDGSWGDHGMFEGGNNTSIPLSARRQPRADYWAAWILKNRWMASSVSLQVVSATSSQDKLPAWGMLRGDGHLALLVVNLDPNVTFTASVQLSGFTPATNGDITTYAGASDGGFYHADYAWLQNGYDSYAVTDLTPSTAVLGGIAATFNRDIPPYSITVIDMLPLALTSTPTPSTTSTPTPSRTLSPSPSPSPSASASRSPTATFSSSATPGSSGTWTSTLTATPTRSATPSATPSSSQTPSATVSPSGTPSGTPATATRTTTPTNSATATGSPSPSPVLSPTATAAATPAGQGFRLLKALVAPNPSRGADLGLAFQLGSDARSAELRIYGKGMALIHQRLLGSVPGGWNRINLPDLSAANGLYYFVLKAMPKEGDASSQISGKFLILR